MVSQSLELLVDLPELDIPAGYLSVVPSLSVHTPANAFRFHVLQERQSALVLSTASTSLSTSPPSATYDPSALARDPIPPPSHLRQLKKHILYLPERDRLMLRSIRNPIRSEELLPLWAVTVWDEVSALRDFRDMWNNAYSWIKDRQTTQQYDGDTREALACFSRIGWNAPLLHHGLRGVTTLALPQFLSNGRVNDEAIDLMVHFLSSKDTLPSNVLIARLSLSGFISSLGTENEPLPPSPPHIRQIEERLPHLSRLYLPLFYAQYSHWIAFEVDIAYRKVTYSMFYFSYSPVNAI